MRRKASRGLQQTSAPKPYSPEVIPPAPITLHSLESLALHTRADESLTDTGGHGYRGPGI